MMTHGYYLFQINDGPLEIYKDCFDAGPFEDLKTAQGEMLDTMINDILWELDFAGCDPSVLRKQLTGKLPLPESACYSASEFEGDLFSSAYPVAWRILELLDNICLVKPLSKKGPISDWKGISEICCTPEALRI